MDNTKGHSRRNFLTQTLLGWFAVTILPVVYTFVEFITPPRRAAASTETISAGKYTEIPENSAKIMRFDKKPIILVRTEQDQVRALSAVCTHLGCIVEFKPDERRFKCNCHGSVFDMNGKNLEGPATRPLEPFRVAIKNENILISRT